MDFQGFYAFFLRIPWNPWVSHRNSHGFPQIPRPPKGRGGHLPQTLHGVARLHQGFNLLEEFRVGATWDGMGKAMDWLVVEPYPSEHYQSQLG